MYFWECLWVCLGMTSSSFLLRVNTLSLEVLLDTPTRLWTFYGYGFYLLFENIYLFGYTGSYFWHVGTLSWRMGSLNSGIWDLLPWPGIESRPLCWECRVTIIGPPGKYQILLLKMSLNIHIFGYNLEWLNMTWISADLKELLLILISLVLMLKNTLFCCLYTLKSSQIESMWY